MLDSIKLYPENFRYCARKRRRQQLK